MYEVTSEDISNFARWVVQFQHFETPRLFARRFTATDAELLHDAMQHERVSRWIAGFEQPFNLSAARRWLAPRLDRMDAGDGVYGGVFHRGSGTLMGFFYAVMMPKHGGVEIAGALNDLYWGKRFVEEFSFAFINDLFRAEVPRIVATCATDNWSSLRVLRALNMEEEGTVSTPTPQGDRMSRLFTLTPARWNKTILTPIGAAMGEEDIRARRRDLLALCRDMKSARDALGTRADA